MLRAMAFVGCVAVGVAAQAAVVSDLVPGVDFGAPGTQSSTGLTYSLGFTFTVSSSTVANQLGYYDAGQDGLTQAHAVGLYSSTGTLLRTATVTDADPWGPAGSGAWFKWHAMAEGPITLLPGVTYVVAGVTGTEAYMWDPTGFTNELVTYQAGRYTSSSVLVFPTQPTFGTRYFGANIGFVPEPAAVAVAGIGSISLLRRRVRRAK